VTDVKVVDASAAAAVLYNEPEASAVARRLEGARLVAPAIFAFELSNVCLVKCRRHPAQRSLFLAWFRARTRLGVQEVAVDSDAVLDLALTMELTFYDASYLWLARRLGAELVTLDKALHRAAAR